MTQPGFFKQPEPMTLAEVAALTGAQLADPAPAGQTVSGTSTLDQAGPRDLAFFDKRKYGDELNRSHAGACLVSANLQADVPGHNAVLRVASPYAAFVEVARVLNADTLRPAASCGNEWIADSAIVHPDSLREDGVIVDRRAVIGPGAEICAGTVIGSSAVIGAGVKIGRNCSVGPGATILHCFI